MHPSNGYDEYHRFQSSTPSQSQPQSQPRRAHPQQHRRHRPRPELILTVDTYEANACDETPDITTPLSPPPSHGHNHNQAAAHSQRAPAIPYKSSQRSLRSALSASSPISNSHHPPIPSRSGSRGNQFCADSPQRQAHRNNNNNKVSPTGHDPVSHPSPDWAAHPAVETFLDTLPDPFSPIEMPNTENDDYSSPVDRFDPEGLRGTQRRPSGPQTPPRPDERERYDRNTTRDSHDLSLSPRNVTRDSLLGNMLLSLDQFSMVQMNCAQSGTPTATGFGDPSSYYYNQRDPGGSKTMTSTAATSAGRNGNAGDGMRGRAHGYSYSSDYDGRDDDHLSRVSSNMSRSRRSNSSSTGFQSNIGRVNSLHELPKVRTPRVTHSTQAGKRALHSRGGRGSKGSSTSSIDTAAGYANVLGSQRWAHGIGGRKRSSSLEIARRPSFGTQPPDPRIADNDLHSQPQPSSLRNHSYTPQHPHQQLHGQPWHLELANSLFNYSIPNFDDYMDDAAPTPTIPVGPRRLTTMPSLPTFARPEPMSEPLSPVRSVNLNLERKRSAKSARSNHTTTTRQSNHSASRLNSRAGAGHGQDSVPPVPRAPLTFPGGIPASSSLAAPADLDFAAPAPHVGYEKAKDKEPVHAHMGAATANAAMQPKEKQPGFFRRMFGGGGKNAALDQSASSGSPTSSSVNSPAGLGPNNNTMGSSISNISSRPAHQQTPVNASPSQPGRSTSSHGLQKKPSGFFRRRKKSISVATDAPPLPTTLPPAMIAPAELPPQPKRLEILTPRPGPSPATSLRKAMDPFLKSSSSGPSSGDNSPSQSWKRDDLTLSVYHSAVEEINDPADRIPRSFSPDYEPDPRATIRSVKPDARGRLDTGSRPGTPPQDATRPPYNYERSGSFLHDNSESDGSPQRVRDPAPQSSHESRQTEASGPGRLTLAPLQTDMSAMSAFSTDTVKDKKMSRLTQDSMSSTLGDRPSSLQLPIEGARTNPDLKTRLSTASIPSVQIDASDPGPKTTTTSKPKPENPLDEPEFVVGDPTEDDKAKARKIFDGNEDFIPKEKAASWMGEEGPIRQRTLRAYMELYDFTNKSVATSLRDVCNRLVFRAETQQVDRILVCFSQRWCDCNPHHGFKSTDVIHTICYSIMLLNTDLHLADIESKMTRSQFIKNTMTTIRQAVSDSVPEAFDRPSILPGKGSNLGDRRHSGDHDRTSFRDSFIKLPLRAGSALGEAPAELDDCGPLVKAPFDGTMKAWETQMELVLKDIYNSIRDERLPLYGAEPVSEQLPSAGGLSVIGMLKRSPSVLSKAASENPSSRGRGPDSIRAGNSRWNSKSRSRPRGFGNPGFSSSRTSFEDGQSIWSPVDSVATWSRASLGRTHTSMSMDSFGSRFPRGDYQQSIGFANALSQAIIREDPRSSVPSLLSDELKTSQLLEDDSLELAGPPWIKEGIIIHKHHLDGVDKKAKDRNWTEVFAVIQKGTISIFSFSPNKSTGRRGRNAVKKGAVVGGGNWQENATALGTWSLRLALASALPPPGYSKQRPHVWALSLPTGAVHLFHVGTPEICSEFVTTANYWAARLSTHPLVGGVSNVEYGWSDAIVNNSLMAAINETAGSSTPAAATTAKVQLPTGRQRSGSATAVRTSMHSRGSSFRSTASFDFGTSSPRPGNLGAKLPGDRVTIAEWTPPTQSARLSNAPEKEQLEVLTGYVRSIEEELQQHNSYRSPMLLAFTPRGGNSQRAMANWERKSAYLLREIVKFRTYVDVLQLAETRRGEVYRERDIARRAARGSLEIERLSFDGPDGGEGGGSVGGEEEEERGRTGGVRNGGFVDEDEGDSTLRAA